MVRDGADNDASPRRNESVTKSNRGGSAWVEKQKNAATKIVTKKLPGWVRCVDGKLALDPAGAETVRRVFRLVREGHGVHVIAEKLNVDRVPVLGRTTFKDRAVVWNETVVYHILKSQATIGVYQPCRGRGSDRKPCGEPVTGYFPPVIDADEWHAVQGIMQGRAKCGRGRRGKHVNLFAGLLVDARDGSTLTYKHLGDRPATLIPVGAKQGRGTKWTSYPAKPFETAILRKLREVRVSDIQGDNKDTRKVETLAGRIAEVNNLIKLWTAKMNNPAIVDTVAAKLAATGRISPTRSGTRPIPLVNRGVSSGRWRTSWKRTTAMSYGSKFGPRYGEASRVSTS